ncbi:DNA repair protein RadC [Clostridium sp. 'deep sea']|uniref:RadC family protein n=1 Tax=Clostridium sp. 'deep sea' TaxID=2779445 RepID=UPI0018969874|nr:DNA repair protein RadC [Clostridium sp. 'deep sea']QOR36343.1 DNA repair protein RadC [Clostridium sp. 'deep sea']
MASKEIAQNMHYTIKDMVPDERPRERMVKLGEQYLKDSELIALVLTAGSRHNNERVTALDLANHILAKYSLSDLINVTVPELLEIHGVGVAKATRLKAALEISRRIAIKTEADQYAITSPESAANFLIPRLRYRAKEYFLAVLLDSKNKVIKCCEVHVGTVNASLVHPREVFREAIRHSAVSCILAHNHPSGDTTPSGEDLGITRRLVQVGEIIGINIIDHLIIGHNSFLSFKREGIL